MIAPSAAADLPRLLLIADVPGWIFDRHARVLRTELSGQFRVDIAYSGQAFREDDYDLIHPLEWNLVPLAQIRRPEKWLTGIRSHISWLAYDPEAFAKLLGSLFGGVYVVSRRLLDLFQPYLPEVVQLSHGVDTGHFLARVPVSDRAGRLRIGWAGNPASPAKGFETFVRPVGELPGVELVCSQYGERMLNQDEMRGFYEAIDAYVCTSSTEGHNNSLLEAGAMERAIITTDVGTVPEFLADGVNALIVPRTAEAFREAVFRLRDDPGLRRRLAQGARPAVLEQFAWATRIAGYRRFFQARLGQAQSGPAGGGPATEGLWAPMAEQVGRLVREGRTRVIVCGATELALDAARELTERGVAILALSDRRFLEFPGGLGGFPVQGLEQALALAPAAVLVAAVQGAPAIRKEIQAWHEARGRIVPPLYSVLQ